MTWRPTDPTELTLFVAGIGFIGGLAGALIGFVGNWITTSRQIARQERDRRRAVYWRYLHATSTYQGGIRRRQKLLADFEALRAEGYGKPLAARTNSRAMHEVSAIEVRVTDLKERVDSESALLTGQIEELHHATNEVALYGGEIFRSAARRVHERGLDLLRAASEPDIDEAEDRYLAAAANFLSLARADTRAPGSAPLDKVTEAVRQIWSRDDARFASNQKV